MLRRPISFFWHFFSRHLNADYIQKMSKCAPTLCIKQKMYQYVVYFLLSRSKYSTFCWSSRYRLIFLMSSWAISKPSLAWAIKSLYFYFSDFKYYRPFSISIGSIEAARVQVQVILMMLKSYGFKLINYTISLII